MDHTQPNGTNASPGAEVPPPPPVPNVELTPEQHERLRERWNANARDATGLEFDGPVVGVDDDPPLPEWMTADVETVEDLPAGQGFPWPPPKGRPTGPETPEQEQARIDAELEAMVTKRFVQYAVEQQARERLTDRIAAARFERPPYFKTLTEQLQREREPRQARLAGLADVGANVLIQARHKTGKTTLTANLVRALADGSPFLGSIDVTPPVGRVGLVNFEMSPDQMDDWLADLGITNTDRVSVLNLRGYRLPLISTEVQRFLTGWASECGLEVLILDPWGRAMSGSGSENSNDDVRAVLEILGEIKREAGVRDLYVLAHIGHAEAERARGASELLGWPDVLWLLTRNDAGTRYLSAEGRDVEFPEVALTFDPASRALALAGGGVSRAQATEDAAVARVLKVVRAASSPLKVTEVLAALHADGMTNHDACQAALKAARQRAAVLVDPDPTDRRIKRVYVAPNLDLAADW
jgi:hypothetical protein